MKLIIIVVLFSLFQLLYSADCDIPKNDIKIGGCKIEVSENLIECLMSAKTEKEKDLCSKKEKSNNCIRIAKKNPKIKNILINCELKYSNKKIDCLLKNSQEFCKIIK